MALRINILCKLAGYSMGNTARWTNAVAVKLSSLNISCVFVLTELRKVFRQAFLQCLSENILITGLFQYFSLITFFSGSASSIFSWASLWSPESACGSS